MSDDVTPSEAERRYEEYKRENAVAFHKKYFEVGKMTADDVPAPSKRWYYSSA